MSSILENIRYYHEDIECLELAAAEILLAKARKELWSSSDHCIDHLVRHIQQEAAAVSSLDVDLDGRKVDEIRQIGGEGSLDVWHSFYSKLRDSKEYSKRHSDKYQTALVPDVTHWIQEASLYSVGKTKSTSPDEAGGKFLAMFDVHNKFINLKRVRELRVKNFLRYRWVKYSKPAGPDESNTGLTWEEFSSKTATMYRDPDYCTWLQGMHEFHEIPRYMKYRDEEFKAYLESCVEYLTSFVRAHRPLLDIDSKLFQHSADFELRWAERTILGWEKLTKDLETYSRPTDRLLASDLAMTFHIQSKEFKRANEKYSQLSEDVILQRGVASEARDKEIAHKEEIIKLFRELLLDTIDDTIDYITRKQARTSREIEQELSELETGNETQFAYPDSDASSSGGEEIDMNDRSIYNPLNLPLGWDGKPIPYWMYKLHGLGHEFKCEICGNASYWGRRAFDKHFSEWKHINGLKALRIPNSNQFHGINGIEDAIRLHEKLRKDTVVSIFNTDKEMECEDAMGNVMSYRAYQDLAKQGML